MRALLNAMTERAHGVAATRAHACPGLVTGYNPNTYSVKVTLQPDDVETGWLPLLAVQVGNGWGIYCPPAIGDLVQVFFNDGEIEAGVVMGGYFNNVDVPLAVPSEELWMVHKTGSFLKFLNDGSVEVNSAADLRATVGGNLTAEVAGDLTATATQHTLNGPVQVNGSLRVSEDISDLNGEHGTVAALRETYDTHTHPVPNVESGPDSTTTDAPTETI